MPVLSEKKKKKKRDKKRRKKGNTFHIAYFNSYYTTM